MTTWVGLTGGIGSGKSTVSRLFTDLSIPVINADQISHAITQTNGEAMPKIIEIFGRDICDFSGSLNRAILRKKVLAEKRYLILLENILHPIILKKIKIQKTQYNRAVYGLIEIPLLIEKPVFQQLVQRTLVVDSIRRLRVQRIQQRSRLSIKEISRIMNQQCSRHQRQLYADDIILNNSSLLSLKHQVEKLHSFYLQYFAYE